MLLSKRAKNFLKEPSAIVKGHLACAKDPFSKENPQGYLNFGIAENRLIDDLALETLKARPELSAEHIHYGPLEGLQELRDAFSGFAQRHLGIPEIDPEMVVVQCGLSAVCESMAYVFFEKDDEIITPTPYYSGFEHDFSGRFGVKLAPAEIASEGHSIQAIKEAFTSKTKGLLLTHPHNPTGEVLSEKFLKEALDFCQEKDIHFITDEIYALSVLDGRSHKSALNLNKEYKKVHFLYGMAKDFGLAGAKTGFYYSRSPECVAAMRAVSYFHPVSSSTQALLADFLKSEKPRAFTKESTRRVGQALNYILQNSPGLNFKKPEAGMFFLADFRNLLSGNIENENDLYNFFLNEMKINMTPGISMGMREPGFFRVCYARPGEELSEFCRRINKLV